MELLFLFSILFFIAFLQALVVIKGSKWPAFCSSLTKLGPLSLFKNPSTFTDQMRKKFKTDIFSCYFFFKRVTFVFGEENVYKITTAPNEVLNFEESYAPFLSATFGSNMLTSYTLQPQVAVLVKYLTYNHLQEYVVKSSKLVTKLIYEKFSKTDTCNLEPILRDIVFQVGTRNFLGDKFLRALPNYDFKSIFSGFEMGLRLALYYGPSFLTKIKDYYDSKKQQSIFDRVVTEMAKEKITNPTNMFEEILYQHDKENSPTLNDDKTLINLVKLFVFGSSFNSYNHICFIIQDLIRNPDKWQKLKEEQIKINFDPETLTQEKLAEMKLLNEEIMEIACQNPFPFLLRTAKQDFSLGSVIIPKGDLIAFSPKINNDSNDNLLFGHGVHACPAIKYAKNSMMVVLSLFIYHFQFTPQTKVEEFKNKRIITFSMQNPIPVIYVRS
jgi:cytochrome P450